MHAPRFATSSFPASLTPLGVSEVFFYHPTFLMTDAAGFDVQGHRGARGLRPENTLSGFEFAIDLGVTSIETDVHLTRDGVPVLFHDPRVSSSLCSRLDGGPVPDLLLSWLDLVEVRTYRVDRNADPQRFPGQEKTLGALTRLFAEQTAIDPWSIPTLADLFAFAAAYAGPLGEQAGKTAAHVQRAKQVMFEVELKRVPFEPETIGDGFDGTAPAALERRVLAEAERAGVVDRVRVRSFDHRSVRRIAQLRPRLRTALLIGEMAPLRPAELLAVAGAEMYCPDYHFVDAAIVRQVHEGGKRIVPWTVNESEAWARLIAWNVDGITTDFPDRLLEWLKRRGIRVGGHQILGDR